MCRGSGILIPTAAAILVWTLCHQRTLGFNLTGVACYCTLPDVGIQWPDTRSDSAWPSKTLFCFFVRKSKFLESFVRECCCHSQKRCESLNWSWTNMHSLTIAATGSSTLCRILTANTQPCTLLCSALHTAHSTLLCYAHSTLLCYAHSTFHT